MAHLVPCMENLERQEREKALQERKLHEGLKPRINTNKSEKYGVAVS